MFTTAGQVLASSNNTYFPPASMILRFMYIEKNEKVILI